MSMSKTVLYCKICGKEISALGMPSHLHRKHGLSGKEYYEKYCSKKEHDGVCKICGKPTTFQSIEHGYRTFCSSKCANSDSEVLAKHAATVLERYGPDGLACKEIRDKTKATNLRKYGVEHTLQLPHVREQMLKSTWTEEACVKRSATNKKRYGTACVFSSKIVQDKIASTNLEKYGSENVFGSKIIQDKIAATNLERYDNENVLSSSTIKAKIHNTMVERYGGMGAASDIIAQRMKETNLKRYGVENAYASSDIVAKINETSTKRVQQFCDKYKCTPIKDLPFEFAGFAVKESGVTVLSYYKNIQYIYNTDIDKVKQVAATIQRQYEAIGSAKENEVANFVKSICEPLGIEVIQRTRKVIAPLELDIYIPSHKLAFEFNGTYWHSENAGMDKFYHKNKTYLCNANDVRLIHIFEYDWDNCKDICMSIISDALNIHTTTYSMSDYSSLPIYDKNIVSNFLHQNSLDGPISDSVIYHTVGLFHNTTNELIQVV